MQAFTISACCLAPHAQPMNPPGPGTQLAVKLVPHLWNCNGALGPFDLRLADVSGAKTTLSASFSPCAPSSCLILRVHSEFFANLNHSPFYLFVIFFDFHCS